MNVRKAHKIWIEQCEAAQTIKARFGLTAAFDCLVGEKLMSFACAAFRHPDFARELPRFVSEVRNERNVDVLEREEDDLLREGPAAVAECVQQFMLVKELLTAPMLGTS